MNDGEHDFITAIGASRIRLRVEWLILHTKAAEQPPIMAVPLLLYGHFSFCVIHVRTLFGTNGKDMDGSLTAGGREGDVFDSFASLQRDTHGIDIVFGCLLSTLGIAIGHRRNDATAIG